jgi:hypothetical protein
MASYSYGKKTRVRRSGVKAVGPTSAELERQTARMASAPPIPDRVGDQQQQRFRRAQEQNRAWNNYHNDPGMFGRDGGMSPNDAADRGDQVPERRRRSYRRNDWSSKQSYEQGRGLWLPQNVDPRRRNQRA